MKALEKLVQSVLDLVVKIAKIIPLPGFVRKILVRLVEIKKKICDKIPMPRFVRNIVNKVIDALMSVAKGD